MPRRKRPKMVPASLTLAAEITPVTYRFHGEHFGWSHCTIDETTAELSINSDWGSWAHCWGAGGKHLGAPSLHAFIAKAHFDYLARKLCPGGSYEQWSSEATAEALRELVVQRRWEDGNEEVACAIEGIKFRGNDDPWRRTRSRKHLTRDIARQIWDELGELATDCGDGDTAAALFYERLPPEVHEYITDCAYEYGRTEYSRDYDALVEIVLPPLAAVCKERAALYKAGVGRVDPPRSNTVTIPLQLAAELRIFDQLKERGYEIAEPTATEPV